VQALLPDEGLEKPRSDWVGYFTNAAQEGDDPIARVRDLYEKAGYVGMEGRNAIYEKVNKMNLSPQTRNAYLASIDRVYGVTNPYQGRGGTEEYGSNYIGS
jgi:proline dehydrogenase